MYDHESKAKIEQATQPQCGAEIKTAYGMGLNTACEEPSRELLTRGLASRLHRARREKAKTDQLEELIYLLDKNPEVARILDLIDAVGR